jgi:hypothetical protein
MLGAAVTITLASEAAPQPFALFDEDCPAAAVSLFCGPTTWRPEPREVHTPEDYFETYLAEPIPILASGISSPSSSRAFPEIYPAGETMFRRGRLIW